MTHRYDKIIDKFDLAYRMEHVNQLHQNPYEQAQIRTGLPEDHPATKALAKQLVREWNKDCRRAAFISDDTYEGMNIDDAIRIMMEEGFIPGTQMPNGDIRFVHQFLGMGATPRCTGNSKLTNITLDVAMKVHVEQVTPHTCCGLGLYEPELKGDHFYATIDATGGLRTKMFALKTMADINRPVAPATK